MEAPGSRITNRTRLLAHSGSSGRITIPFSFFCSLFQPLSLTRDTACLLGFKWFWKLLSLSFARPSSFYLAPISDSEGSSPQIWKEVQRRATETTSHLKSKSQNYINSFQTDHLVNINNLTNRFCSILSILTDNENTKK